jgi:hypothetical protein
MVFDAVEVAGEEEAGADCGLFVDHPRLFVVDTDVEEAFYAHEWRSGAAVGVGVLVDGSVSARNGRRDDRSERIGSVSC